MYHMKSQASVRRNVLRTALTVFTLLLAVIGAQAQQSKQKVLWQKLQDEVHNVDRNLDGILGVAVKDLNSGEEFLINGDEVMPQASSIKIAILEELYQQADQKKLKLTDEYVVRKEDLVPGSNIMLGLTPGVTLLTLSDLATMMVAVSDNSATNVLIDRAGMENVNAMLES